jgi:thioredoxin-related protein
MSSARCVGRGGASALAVLLFFGFACSPKEEKGPESRPAEPPPRVGEWFTDYDAARERATKESKYVMALFTGSDWCPPCAKLQREVLSTPEFLAWASENVVLLEFDFPRTRPVPEEVKQRNQSFTRILGVTAFPTVIFMTPIGTEIARIGYQAGGPERWIREVEKGLPVRPR